MDCAPALGPLGRLMESAVQLAAAQNHGTRCRAFGQARDEPGRRNVRLAATDQTPSPGGQMCF